MSEATLACQDQPQLVRYCCSSIRALASLALYAHGHSQYHIIYGRLQARQFDLLQLIEGTHITATAVTARSGCKKKNVCIGTSQGQLFCLQLAGSARPEG